MKKLILTVIFFLILLSWGEISVAQLIVGQIEIEGNNFFKPHQLEGMIKTKLNQTFNSDMLQNDIGNLLKLYENNGFPYCRVKLENFKIIENKKLNFKLRIDEGPRVRIGEVNFGKLRFTKPKTLHREIKIKEGDYFSQEQVDLSIDKLERLSYIKEIREIKLESDVESNLAFVTFDILENMPNSINGILGYVPGRGNKEGYFAGRVDLILDNIFGSGRKVEVNWGKKDPHSSDLLFDYWEPWFLGFPLSLGLNLNQVDYDSAYFKFGLGTKVKLELWDKMSWGLFLGWEKVVPDVAGESYLANSRKYSGGVEASLDLRDSFKNPRQGIYYKTEIIYSKKFNYATAQFTPERSVVYETRYVLDLENFIPTFAYQCLAWGVHLGGMRSDEKIIPFVDQFKLGGLNSLRGYREEEFAGSRIVWSNLEYRYLLSYDSRIFGFVDWGYFYKLSQEPQTKLNKKISDDKWSYGFGLSIGSNIGVFGISYAIGEDDKITNGKVHFGIVNRF